MLEQRITSSIGLSDAKSRAETGQRLVFIDNLRWVVIMLVVLMHLNVTYSTWGLWYYLEARAAGPLSQLLFGMYGSLNQAYMMGLLFLIAGYFVPGSFDRKGFKPFVTERIVRLGIPTLIYMLLIHPVTMMIYYFFNQTLPPNIAAWYGDYITSLTFLSTSGPMWFALALLIFSVIYALLRQRIETFTGHDVHAEPIVLTHKIVLTIIGIIAITAFLTRIVMPAGVTLFNTVTGNFMQLGFFPSYIVLFICGILAYRHHMLANLTYPFGKFWLKLALFLGIPLWFVVINAGAVSGDLSALFGGWHWQSAAYAAWESFFAVAVSIGLLALFREKFNQPSQLSAFLSDNAFGVYVFHPPIVVAITMALSAITIVPVVKMYLVALIVLPVCFAFAYEVRNIPVVRKFFS